MYPALQQTTVEKRGLAPATTHVPKAPDSSLTLRGRRWYVFRTLMIILATPDQRPLDPGPCLGVVSFVAMPKLSRATAGALLLGFLGANVFVAFCVVAAPVMTGCPMPMSDSNGPAWSADDDCCLSCVASTTLLASVGIGAPAGVAVLPPGNVSSLLAAISTFEYVQGAPVLPTVSPPAFLLNSTFLI